MDPTAVAMPRSGLDLVDLAGVAVYLLITIGIVIWSSRRQSTTEDFFLGGRRMPWMAVGLSMLATLMSSISYMGLPGEMLAYGVTMFLQYIALPFSMLVILGLWVPFFMRLRLTSAYEYLERRFDYRVRLLGGFLFLLLRLGWMSMVMYVGSMALSQMTESLIPETVTDPIYRTPLRETFSYWVIGAIGITATIYACAGGIRAAIWNDVLQSVMLLGGTLITLGYVIYVTGTGPIEWWQTARAELPQHVQPQWFSLDPGTRMTVFTAVLLAFFWTICTHGSDQVVLQRYFSTPSLAAARRSYIVTGLTDMTVGVLLGFCGLALLAFYLKNPTYLPKDMVTFEPGKIVAHHADRVMPYFFAHQLPAGIGGILLAVLLCDAMQTLVSGVNSIGAVFMTDIFERLSPGEGRRIGQVKLARILSLAIGLLVTILGLGVASFAKHSGRNIIEMMAPAFNMFLGPLACLFLIGMFLKCRANTALWTVFFSMIISFLWSYWPDLSARFDLGSTFKPSITLTTAVPYLGGFAIAAVLTLLFDRGVSHPGFEYTWRAVMRRPVPDVEQNSPS